MRKHVWYDSAHTASETRRKGEGGRAKGVEGSERDIGVTAAEKEEDTWRERGADAPSLLACAPPFAALYCNNCSAAVNMLIALWYALALFACLAAMISSSTTRQSV